LLRREPADRPDAGQAARMITSVLPVLADRAPGSPAGYEATALSASSPPAPGSVSPGPVSAGPGSPGSGSPGSPGLASPGSASPGLSGAVRPRTPVPDENSLAYQPTVIKPPDPPAANTGPPRGAPASAAAAAAAASAAQTAPTTPQPSQPSTPPQGGWGQGAGSGYAPGSSGYGSPDPARPEGSQPDFSSWYNQSPRSGASSPPGSGSGYPPPAGYAPAAWSGQASQQPPDWSGAEYAPRRPRRSGFGWKAAVVALAIVGAAAGAGTVVLLHQGHSGSPQGQGQTTGTGTGSASGSASGSSSASLPPPTL